MVQRRVEDTDYLAWLAYAGGHLAVIISDDRPLSVGDEKDHASRRMLPCSCRREGWHNHDWTDCLCMGPAQWKNNYWVSNLDLNKRAIYVETIAFLERQISNQEICLEEAAIVLLSHYTF